MTTTPPLIELKNLRFRWQANTADIIAIDDLVVRSGERVFIQGASGSGKTTLLSLIGGVIVPHQGFISILGTRVSKLNGSARDKFRADHIGFIFQMFNLIPYLSLADNVVLPCRFSALRRKQALRRSKTLRDESHRLLTHLALDVDRLSKRPVIELSVGQQQRVAAARALIGGPALIIADEPTSALDQTVRSAFLELLFEEVESVGSSLLFVSHDSSLQSQFDRTIELTSINHATPQR